MRRVGWELRRRGWDEVKCLFRREGGVGLMDGWDEALTHRN